MSGLSKDFIFQCQKSLLMMKQDILNRLRSARLDLTIADKMSGDEIDQTVAQLEENHFVVNQERMRIQLFEIESALARIENGQYGVCEETQEPIEQERLLAIPYTRLSIEGAEMREALRKKYAR